MNSINWSAPNIWVFLVHLVKHYSTNAEAMGLNSAEALKIFKLHITSPFQNQHSIHSVSSIYFPIYMYGFCFHLPRK